MKHFKELLEKKRIIPTEPKELKDIIKDKENAQDYWADFITYDGIKLFDVYMNFLDWMSSNAEDLKETSWTEQQEEEVQDDEGNWETEYYDEEIRRDLQESYLGYIPKTDEFVTGYDMWEGDDNPAGIAYWKLKNGKFKLLKEHIAYDSSMMYGNR